MALEGSRLAGRTKRGGWGVSYIVDELTKMIEKLDGMSTEEIVQMMEACKVSKELAQTYIYLERYLCLRE